MADKRSRYSPQQRLRAGELYVQHNMSVQEISDEIGVAIGTLRKWCWEDRWIEDKKEQFEDGDSSGVFARTLDYLMRSLNRLAERLWESTQDDALPDENLELRINRLTLAFERVQPMGTFLRTRQRVDVVKEIKQMLFDEIAKNETTDADGIIAFRVLERYLNTLELVKKAT